MLTGESLNAQNLGFLFLLYLINCVPFFNRMSAFKENIKWHEDISIQPINLYLVISETLNQVNEIAKVGRRSS